MKLLLEIQENKVDFVLELLRNLSFVKATPVERTKEEVVEDFIQALEEVKQHQEGKIQLQSAEDLLDEL